MSHNNQVNGKEMILSPKIPKGRISPIFGSNALPPDISFIPSNMELKPLSFAFKKGASLYTEDFASQLEKPKEEEKKEKEEPRRQNDGKKKRSKSKKRGNGRSRSKSNNGRRNKKKK